VAIQNWQAFTRQSITPGSTVSVVVTWTPIAEGPMSIYGKVVLTGDVNPVNDNSPVMNISVMPPGATVVTIGEGNLAEGVPWEIFSIKAACSKLCITKLTWGDGKYYCDYFLQ
jgi:hypothetical protein